MVREAERTGRPGVPDARAPRRDVGDAAVSRHRRGLRAGRARLRARPAAGQPGGALPVRRRRHRPARAARPSPACSRRAKWRARGCTARTAWPATRCSKGWSSAPAPPRRWRLPQRRRRRCRRRSSSDRRPRPCRRRRRRPCGAGVPALMWRAAGLVRRRRAALGRAGPRPRPAGGGARSALAERAGDGRAWQAGQHRARRPGSSRAPPLRRTESRGGHRRADFPERDDVHWKVHVGDRRRHESQRSGPDELRSPARRMTSCRESRHDQIAGTARDRNHAPDRGLLALVSRRRPQGGAGRLLAGQGLHGHPPVRLRDLGADPAAARRAVQGDRARQRVLPAVHSREPHHARGRARRGLCAAGGAG